MEYESQILKNNNFKGNYSGLGKLILDGKFDGNLIIEELIISKTGQFSGKVEAKSIIVNGILKADVEVEKIYISSDGIVDGDLLYRDIIIEEGGLLSSTKVIKMSDAKSFKKFKFL